MPTHPKPVLVTGITGFLGSHVAYALLNAGYAVRGTVRGSRLEPLRNKLGASYPVLELVQVDDIAGGDFTEALKGVDSVVHVASTMPGTGGAEDILNGALEGTLNILRQATNAGIKKIVLTSSEGTTFSPDADLSGRTLTESDWGQVTKEDVLIGKYSHDSMRAYIASKILAEKAAWEFAEQHPELDLATVNPAFLWGPYVPHFPIPASLGTNEWIYALLKGKKPPTVLPNYVDVRDAARAHVAALELPPLVIPPGAARNQQALQKKRFLVCGGILTWRNSILLLHEKRPELKNRLLERDTYGDVDVQQDMNITISVSRAEEVLGFGKGKGKVEWIGWEKCLLDTVDSFLEAEKNQTLQKL
ncbi:hypothetical protein AX16_010200 [Volvariella volvacea WC 439]|nr:hypothetical protein AX16_010200 [Volvariella volvacea WC 439]